MIRHAYTAAVRKQLFRTNLGPSGPYSQYDRNADWLVEIPPSPNDGTSGGVNVQVQIKLHKVDSLEPTFGHLDVSIWFRLQWNDPRLAWDRRQF